MHVLMLARVRASLKVSSKKTMLKILGPLGQMSFTVLFYEKTNIYLKTLRVGEPGYTPECYFGGFLKLN